MKQSGLGQIKDAISIRERPASVEDRAVPGHWEGDLIGGSKNSYVATLVERQSRYVILVRLPEKTTQTGVRALAARVRRLPIALRKSRTWDRGTELTEEATAQLNAEVFSIVPIPPAEQREVYTVLKSMRRAFGDFR